MIFMVKKLSTEIWSSAYSRLMRRAGAWLIITRDVFGARFDCGAEQRLCYAARMWGAAKAHVTPLVVLGRGTWPSFALSSCVVRGRLGR